MKLANSWQLHYWEQLHLQAMFGIIMQTTMKILLT
jgi:hypothetical protein